MAAAFRPKLTGRAETDKLVLLPGRTETAAGEIGTAMMALLLSAAVAAIVNAYGLFRRVKMSVHKQAYSECSVWQFAFVSPLLSRLTISIALLSSFVPAELKSDRISFGLFPSCYPCI